MSTFLAMTASANHPEANIISTILYIVSALVQTNLNCYLLISIVQ